MEIIDTFAEFEPNTTEIDIKKCPSCSSVFITAKECESCGIQFQIDLLGIPFGKRSYWGITQAHQASIQSKYPLFRSFKYESTKKKNALKRKLLHRLDVLAEFLNSEKHYISTRDRRFYIIEIHEITDHLKALGVELNQLWDHLEKFERGPLFQNVGQVLISRSRSESNHFMVRKWSRLGVVLVFMPILGSGTVFALYQFAFR